MRNINSTSKGRGENWSLQGSSEREGDREREGSGPKDLQDRNKNPSLSVALEDKVQRTIDQARTEASVTHPSKKKKEEEETHTHRIRVPLFQQLFPSQFLGPEGPGSLPYPSNVLRGGESSWVHSGSSGGSATLMPWCSFSRETFIWREERQCYVIPSKDGGTGSLCTAR